MTFEYLKHMHINYCNIKFPKFHFNTTKEDEKTMLGSNKTSILDVTMDLNDNQSIIQNMNVYNFDITHRNELSHSLNLRKMTLISEKDQETDENFLEENENNNDITLSVLYQANKLGCSYYDKSKKTLFYLNDLPGKILFSR